MTETGAPTKPEFGHSSDETGLIVFAALLALHRIAGDPVQMRVRYDAPPVKRTIKLSPRQEKPVLCVQKASTL